VVVPGVLLHRALKADKALKTFGYENVFVGRFALVSTPRSLP
jgi:hypothetical protein